MRICVDGEDRNAVFAGFILGMSWEMFDRSIMLSMVDMAMMLTLIVDTGGLVCESWGCWSFWS
jgi:hypothetical protein